MSLKESDARNKDIEMTPNSITSFGTPSTRKSFNTDKVRLLKYTVNDNIKNKVENFCIRYGNKYNNFGVIDLKTYKGYIKYYRADASEEKSDTFHRVFCGCVSGFSAVSEGAAGGNMSARLRCVLKK